MRRLFVLTAVLFALPANATTLAPLDLPPISVSVTLGIRDNGPNPLWPTTATSGVSFALTQQLYTIPNQLTGDALGSIDVTAKQIEFRADGAQAARGPTGGTGFINLDYEFGVHRF